MAAPRLILASTSPRRRALLAAAGVEFELGESGLEEERRAGEPAAEFALRMAEEKALAVSRRTDGVLVLGADTIVVVDEMILGKPVDAEDAARMLRLLSGRVHRVITGVCVVEAAAGRQLPAASKNYALHPAELRPGFEILRTENRELRTGSETTLVTMNQLSDEEIREYVASGEPMDKAGAYAIQGRASRWIPRIEGDYSNVVGLPVALVHAMLGEGPRAV